MSDPSAQDLQRPGPVLFQGMWTQDPGTKAVFRIIEKVAAEDVTVLVRGETGAGKELVAQAVHALSPRRDGPFRAINCAALPPTLLESELFGHVRGAFTGAVRDAPGHFQLAHRGTLFLDEVAELPLELQAKLLRALETGRVLPVGARDTITVDVRIVSATHRALRREVEAGRFRSDLMYRLRVIPVFLPPLRMRPGDPSLLLERFVVEMNAKSRRTIESIAPAVFEAFESYDWPGNVRELRNVLAYAYVIGEGPCLEVGDLPPEVLGYEVPGPELLGSAAPRSPGPLRPAEPSLVAGAGAEGNGSAGPRSAAAEAVGAVEHAPEASAEAGAGPSDTADGPMGVSMFRGGPSPMGTSEELRRIRDALLAAEGRRSEAAAALGMSRVTLWRKMKALGLGEGAA